MEQNNEPTNNGQEKVKMNEKKFGKKDERKKEMHSSGMINEEKVNKTGRRNDSNEWPCKQVIMQNIPRQLFNFACRIGTNDPIRCSNANIFFAQRCNEVIFHLVPFDWILVLLKRTPKCAIIRRSPISITMHKSWMVWRGICCLIEHTK